MSWFNFLMQEFSSVRTWPTVGEDASRVGPGGSLVCRGSLVDPGSFVVDPSSSWAFGPFGPRDPGGSFCCCCFSMI